MSLDPVDKQFEQGPADIWLIAIEQIERLLKEALKNDEIVLLLLLLREHFVMVAIYLKGPLAKFEHSLGH